MKKIRDVENYEEEDTTDEYKYAPRNFRLKVVSDKEFQKRKQWDREDSYRQPDDYDDH